MSGKSGSSKRSRQDTNTNVDSLLKDIEKYRNTSLERRWAGQVVGPAGQPILRRTLHPSLLGVGSIPTISTQIYPPSVHVCDFPLGLKPWSNIHTHKKKLVCACLNPALVVQMLGHRHN